MSWGLYFPLIVAAAVFAILSASAGVMAGRGNEDGAERLRDAGFLVVLAGGAWVVVLLLITLVIVAFFVILLLVLFGLSLLVGRLGRGASRRRRVTTDDL